MGNPLPPDWPEIEDTKWYCCYLDCYNLDDCAGPLQGSTCCCTTGAQILSWINGNNECDAGWELCPFSGYTAQRLIDVKGPYTLRQDCVDACIC